MPQRLKENQERKLPRLSVSIEPSIADDFKLCCANRNKSASEVLREYIMEYIKRKRHGKK